ncbi:Protein of unknown function (DUF3176) domain containing protein [Rhypophila decipiens]
MGIRHNIRRLCSPAFQSDWAWEVTATFLSVTTIASTAITVSFLKGRPMPQWPLTITPNALLSIYAVIFKAAVSFILQSCVGQLQWTWFKSHPRPLADVSLYDAAGRGAWGSVMWLYTLHIRNPLVTLAALVTVVSIAVDPAFQQIIRFSDCPDQVVAAAARITGGPGTSLATVPRTNYVDGSQLYGGSQSNPWLQPPQSALNAGLFTPVKPLAVSCPTGNCTFDTFHTAGYCSTCDDVSTDLRFGYQCADGGGGEEWVPVECNSTKIKSLNTAIISYLTHFNGTTSRMIWNASDYPTGTNLLSGSILLPIKHHLPAVPLNIIMGKTYFSENSFDPLTGEPMENIACNEESSTNTG